MGILAAVVRCVSHGHGGHRLPRYLDILFGHGMACGRSSFWTSIHGVSLGFSLSIRRPATRTAHDSPNLLCVFVLAFSRRSMMSSASSCW